MILSYDKELTTAGATTYQLGTGACWYDVVDGHYDTSRISLTAIDRACAASTDRTDPFVADIEAFSLGGNFDYAVSQLTKAVMRWRTNQPTRPIGFYSLVPSRNYNAPTDLDYQRNRGNMPKYLRAQGEFARWQMVNTRRAAALLTHCDFLVPSIYEFNLGQEARWRVYAEANLLEALRVAGTRLVYPMLMPSTHPGDRAIPLEHWEGMVRFASEFTGVAGLMIYSSPALVADPRWREPVLKYVERPAPPMPAAQNGAYTGD